MEKNTETDMIEQNMSLVKKIVSSISINLPRCIDRNELYSNGLLGLLHATRKFKPNPKASFKTYATIRIRGSMIDGLRRSYKPHKKAGKVRKIFLKLELEKVKYLRTLSFVQGTVINFLRTVILFIMMYLIFTLNQRLQILS